MALYNLNSWNEMKLIERKRKKIKRKKTRNATRCNNRDDLLPP